MQALEQQRNNLVVKSNQLIQRTRYSLSEKEQKIILYLISKIMPEDDELKRYTFSLSDFCRICGVDDNPQHGSNYSYVKQCLQNLHDKSFWVKEPDGKERLYSWIKEAEIDGSIITVELDQKLKPFLLQLKGNFTQYELEYTLAMRGKHPIRIYELLKSYAELGGYDISVSDLRSKLMIDEKAYPEFKEFKRKVLNNSLREINTYTDLDVSVSTIRTGRCITDLHFTIKKKDYCQRIDAISDRDTRLRRDSTWKNI